MVHAAPHSFCPGDRYLALCSRPEAYISGVAVAINYPETRSSSVLFLLHFISLLFIYISVFFLFFFSLFLFLFLAGRFHPSVTNIVWDNSIVGFIFTHCCHSEKIDSVLSD